MRISRRLQVEQAHMAAARAYAELSYARRLKVGSVIVRDNRIISIGFNGTPSGRDNNCELLQWNGSEIKYSLKKITEERLKQALDNGAYLVSKDEVCHAEMNAIMFAAKNGVATNDCDLYVTHSPCFECAKMIVQCGIGRVYYEEEYRDLKPVNFLRECNVFVTKLERE